MGKNKKKAEVRVPDPNRPKIIRRPPGDPLAKLFTQARREHPSLLGVCEFEYDPAVPEPSVDELMKAVGINGYTEVNIGVPQEEAYRQNLGNIGGMVVPVRKKDDVEIHTIIFLRRAKDVPQEPMDQINTALLAHELHHVDDLENGRLAEKDGKIDMMQAEFDAHRHTCKWLWDNGRPDALGFYLTSLHQHVRDIPQRREAARRLIESPEYQQWLAYSGGHFHAWYRRCMQRQQSTAAVTAAGTKDP